MPLVRGNFQSFLALARDGGRISIEAFGVRALSGRGAGEAPLRPSQPYLKTDSKMNAIHAQGPAQEQVGAFQLIVLVLSAVTLGAIAADTFITLPHEVSKIIQGVDLLACAVLFGDFVVRFRAAPSKGDFMKWGWIDLIACIPTVDWLRFGRFVRVLKVLRLLRGVRSLQRLLEVFFSRGRKGGFASIVATAFLLVVFSSAAMLVFETDKDSNIKSAGDAIWWGVTTVTTVGYGDRYPVTMEGRVLAMGLMVSGVGLFSVMSGWVASLFLGQRPDENELLAEVRALRAEITQLKSR